MTPKPELVFTTIKSLNDGHRLEASFTLEGKEFPFYFQSVGSPLGPNAEALLAIAILVCMRTGADLVFPYEIGQQLHDNLEAIQDFFLSWKPHYHRITIQAVKTSVKPASSGGFIGTFFTGGVDSSYTLIKHLLEITHLVHVHGYEYDQNDPHKAGKRAIVAETLRKASTSFNKPVVEIETNIRDVVARFVPGRVSHGTLLAVIAHLLYPYFSRMYIPSTYSFAELFDFGSHPNLDPLWSHEGLELIHDGNEANRFEKIQTIASHAVVLQYLRVCLYSPGSAINCGKCEKCQRTMAALAAIGALERCPTFAENFDLHRLSQVRITARNKIRYYQPILAYLENQKSHPELVKAIHKAIQEPGWQIKIKTAYRKIRRKIVRRNMRAQKEDHGTKN